MDVKKKKLYFRNRPSLPKHIHISNKIAPNRMRKVN